VDPITLGVLAPPADFGADITCGDLQTLGMHMQFGNGHGGFIAVPEEQRFLMELPSRLYGIAPTSVEGEYGFGEVAFERTSLARREKGKEFVGTAASLWGITAGVFLTLMGPSGMRELGESMLYRSRYALRLLSQIPGVQAPVFDGPFFKEFVVRFGGHGRSVEEINDRLLERGIFGGKPLSREFPELSDCALFCFTETHSKADIDRLTAVLTEVLK
jgi:glycine dehydrogenase subunit 1